MPQGDRPPRPRLSSTARNYLVNDCKWNPQLSRVERILGGVPVYAWLGQTGTPGLTATVEWDAGPDPGVGKCVRAVIGQAEWDTIKNGTWNSNTGVVTYQNVLYTFSFEAGTDAPVMKRSAV